MINKNGYNIIIINGILLVIMTLLLVLFSSSILMILTVLCGFLFVFHFFFFRDPDRTTPDQQEVVISPADGRIIKIQEVEENQYLKSKAILVSIFMSVFNVHVNRIPVSGEIEILEHKAGKFMAAFEDKASELNEQSQIVIKTPRDRILFKQIAGFIARRVVTDLQVGDEVRIGERFGMIKYGSRLDVFLPVNAKINVRLKENVKAGETIIAEL